MNKIYYYPEHNIIIVKLRICVNVFIQHKSLISNWFQTRVMTFRKVILLCVLCLMRPTRVVL